MPLNKLSLATPVTGLLLDGVKDTPFVAGTLSLTPNDGVRVEVPFIHGDNDQFRHVDRDWFGREQTPPPNLVLYIPGGAFSLFDVRWHGTSIRTGISLGTLRPSEVVFKERDGELKGPLLVKKMQSNVDGLHRFADIGSISNHHETDEDGLITKLVISVERTGSMHWKQGGATVTVHTAWSTDYPEGTTEHGMNILDEVVIETEFDEPQSFQDHYVEHRKIAYLMTFLFGCGIYFRKHRISDERFTDKMMGGEVINSPFYETVSALSVRNHNQEKPTTQQLQDLSARLSDVGEAGMERWSELFQPWERFILPAQNVLSRKGIFAEDTVQGLAVAMESYAHKLGVMEGEEVTYPKKTPITATWMWRCLTTVGLDWSAVAPSTAALSHAIANNYNDVKHPARGDYPNGDHTLLIAQVCRLVVRLLALKMIDPTGQLVKTYGVEHAVWRVIERFNAYGWKLNARGGWERSDET